jgi:hypothetical protein
MEHPMDKLEIRAHTMKDWNAYTHFGFVPDPMIIRAGEIFASGQAAVPRLGHSDWQVWEALEQNISSIVDFFDMIVTRTSIPLIDYNGTFDPIAFDAPKETFPAQDLFCQVEVNHLVYEEIKKGALIKLAELHLSRIPDQALWPLRELEAFRYDWNPGLSLGPYDPELEAQTKSLLELTGARKQLAQFLLGGLICSGYAQASNTTHHVQSKRSRYYLGLTMSPETLTDLSSEGEDRIFDAAHQSLQNSAVETWRSRPVPPVLPYLLEVTPRPWSSRKLVDAALNFRYSRHHAHYVAAVNSLRADGIGARRSEDVLAVEQQNALDMLAPYSRLDPQKSASLEWKLSTELIGLPGAEMKGKLSVPTWLKVWWNDHAPFGGMKKTMRRMWMADAAYKNLSAKLQEAWRGS